MKLINRRISAFLTSICSVLLSFLGFSCSSSPEEPDYPLMYGMPNGRFEIKGSVTDEEGNDIEDAEIRVTGPRYPSYLSNLIAVTDAKGDYEIKSFGLPDSLKVVCIPVQNNLEPDSVVIKMEYKDADKNDAWDRGHATATVNFKLKEKDIEE